MRDLFERFAAWLLDLLLWVPRKIFELLTDGLAAVLESIDPPGWMQNLGGYVGQVPDSVWFFLRGLELGYGLTVIGSAYALRFLIRRLPVVG